MASIFKPKSQSTTQTQSQTITPLFNGYETQMGDLNTKLNSMANGNVSKYTGTPAIGFTANQQMALNSSKEQLNNQYLNDVLSGKYLDYSKDPSYTSASARLKRELGDAIDSTKTSYGRSGWLSSSGYNTSQGNNIDNYGTGLADLEGRFSDSAKQAIIQAIGVNNQNLSTFANLAGQERAAQNDVEQAKYKEYLRQQGVSESALPLLMQYYSLIRGQKIDGESSSTTNTKTSFLGF